MKNQDEGFTLIELLIVIVILGILAAVVVFAVGGIADRGDASACKADRATVEVAVEAYRAQKGVYPSGVGDLTLNQAFLRGPSTYFTVGNGNGAVTATGTLPTGC